MAELSDGEVCGQRRLFPLLPHDSNPHVGRLDHAHIIPPIPDGAHRLLGVCSKQLHHLRLVSRRATAANNSWTLTGQL